MRKIKTTKVTKEEKKDFDKVMLKTLLIFVVSCVVFIGLVLLIMNI